jgi:polysaccharide export outer membrane protein
MNKCSQLFWFGLALIFLSGCQHPGPRFDPYASARTRPALQTVALTNRLNPEWLHPPAQPFILGPGDVLEMELMDDITSRSVTTVGPDGKIYFNLLPGLDVWGMTLPQTKALLETNLAQFYREQPRVSLTLRGVQSRRVWLLGRLQAPGVYFMTNAPTLLDAIAQAGGTLSLAGQRDLSISSSVDEQADLRRTFIVRHGRRLPVDFERLINQGDLSQNIYLEPDDFVYFPPLTAREVYVMGAVGLPRAVPYQEGMTMAAAITSAGGPIHEAFLSHVAIVRGSLSQPQIALIDYKGVVTGEAPDVILQPQDIVYVPFEPYRYLVRYADLIMNTFVTSVAINEGIRAVSDGRAVAPTGVFIPVGSGVTITPPRTVVGPSPTP